METMHKEVLHKVRPKLAYLEQQRQQLEEQHKVQANWIMLIMVAVILILVCFHVIFALSNEALLYLSLGVIGVGLYAINYYKYPDIDALRKVVGDTVMESLYPEWKYEANAYLPIGQFNHFGLTRKFNKIEGNHLTQGRHGNTNFSFSFTKLFTEGSDSKSPVFNGLILVADFHKSIKGRTLVFPDIAQQFLGSWLGKKVQERGWKGLDLVYLEDPVFEENFAVYSSDQIEARYVLTSSMMERLNVLNDKYENRLSFAFAHGKVCVTIQDLLPAQVNLETTILPDRTFHRFSRPIDLVTEIIDVMELNTRIWEKE